MAGCALVGQSVMNIDNGGRTRLSTFSSGVSLLAMLGISMPLRLIFGIDLDGDSGLIGWMHGVMVMVYTAVLVVTAKAEGWSIPRAALGWFASFLPFGTFVFEAKLPKA